MIHLQLLHQVRARRQLDLGKERLPRRAQLQMECVTITG